MTKKNRERYLCVLVEQGQEIPFTKKNIDCT